MKGRQASVTLQVVLLLGVVFLQHFLWAQCIGRVMDWSGDVRRMESLGKAHFCYTVSHIVTLQETNISPKNGILKMILLFPRWDMVIPWRAHIVS